MEVKEKLFICECSSPEHQIIIRYFNEEPEVYVDIHLVNRSFWGRVKYALKYIFGYKSKYGAWDEIILGPKHIKDLESVVSHLHKHNNIDN